MAIGNGFALMSLISATTTIHASATHLSTRLALRVLTSGLAQMIQTITTTPTPTPQTALGCKLATITLPTMVLA